MEQLLDEGSWKNVLIVHELAYCELTLNVLAMFDRKEGRGIGDEPNAINFWLHRHEYHLSYMEFTLFMGHYEEEYTTIDEYHQLHYSPILGETQGHHWER